MQRNSDMDYRDAVGGFDFVEVAARLDEQAREQRWSDFVEFLQAHFGDDWSKAAYAVYQACQPGDVSARCEVILQFAAEESWPSVYAAIARAMR